VVFLVSLQIGEKLEKEIVDWVDDGHKSQLFLNIYGLALNDKDIKGRLKKGNRLMQNAEMRETGRIPSETGKPGGKETGPKMTFYMEEGPDWKNVF